MKTTRFVGFIVAMLMLVMVPSLSARTYHRRAHKAVRSAECHPSHFEIKAHNITVRVERAQVVRYPHKKHHYRTHSKSHRQTIIKQEVPTAPKPQQATKPLTPPPAVEPTPTPTEKPSLPVPPAIQIQPGSNISAKPGETCKVAEIHISDSLRNYKLIAIRGITATNISELTITDANGKLVGAQRQVGLNSSIDLVGASGNTFYLYTKIARDIQRPPTVIIASQFEFRSNGWRLISPLNHCSVIGIKLITPPLQPDVDQTHNYVPRSYVVHPSKQTTYFWVLYPFLGIGSIACLTMLKRRKTANLST